MRTALTVTVVGWAGTRPREINGDGVPYTSFRVSSTERRYDGRAQTWTDGNTEWFTVKAFRDLAMNVAKSVTKGDPVMVTGRLRTEEWQSEEGPRSTLVIEADAVGHDLSLGRTEFVRTLHRSRAAGDSDALPSAAPGETGPDEPAGAETEPDPWARSQGAVEPAAG